MVKIFMEMSETERAHFRKENIGYIFQNFNLLDTFLTVKENIILPLKLAGKIIDEEDFKQIIKDLEIDDQVTINIHLNVLEDKVKEWPWQEHL